MNMTLEGVNELPHDVSHPPSTAYSSWSRVYRRYQHFLDSIVQRRYFRWSLLLSLSLLYVIRIYFLEGWHIVTYALAIYILNLFILFLSPKIDPAMDEWDLEDDWGESEGPQLPLSSDQEFRPFVRRLPEFNFWLSSTKALLIALFCTCFSIFNIPVFWPILVIYFILLFVLTMKRQIRHMIKFRYLPFTHGKTVYKGKDTNMPMN